MKGGPEGVYRELLGGLGGERNFSIPLRGFTILVSVGFAMNRTDRIRISRKVMP